MCKTCAQILYQISYTKTLLIKYIISTINSVHSYNYIRYHIRYIIYHIHLSKIPCISNISYQLYQIQLHQILYQLDPPRVHLHPPRNCPHHPQLQDLQRNQVFDQTFCTENLMKFIATLFVNIFIHLLKKSYSDRKPLVASIAFLLHCKDDLLDCPMRGQEPL